MTRNLLLSALILFPLWTIAQPNPTIRSFRAEKLYLDGLKKFQQRQFSDAIETFDQVVELNNEHPNVYEARGDAYYQLRDYKMALKDYQRAIDLDQNNANLWNNAGVAAGDMNLYRAAANYFYEAMELDPNHTDAAENFEQARRLLNQEGIAYEGPSKPRPWEDDYYNYDRDRDDRGTFNGSNGGAYGNSSGSSTTGGRDRDDYYDRNDAYGNNGGRSSTRPSKYNVTRPGDVKEREDKFKDGPERNSIREYLYKSPQLTVGPRTDIQLNVDQVRISKNSTMLSFTVKNLGEKSFPIKLAQRGSKEAWYLTDRSFERTYKLKSIKNLDGWNQGRSFNLKARGTQLFIAEFDRIDDDIFFFHLLEGKMSKPGAWNIYDIELKGK